MVTKTENNNGVKRRSFLRRVLLWIWRRKWWILLVAVIVFVVPVFFGGDNKPTRGGYATVEITRGDMRQVVSATGNAQRLGRNGMNNGNTSPEDAAKQERLIVELAAGSKMLELGLPA